MGAEVRLGWDNSDLFQGAKRAESRLQRFDRSVAKVGQGTQRSLSGLNRVLFGIGGSFAAGQIAAEAFRRSVSFDALTRGFSAVVGSSEEAEAQLSRLKRLAEEPGVEYRQAITLSRDLQAAGFSAGEAERMIREVGNAMALMGGSSADMANVVDAMKDLVSEGQLVDDKIDRIAERLPQFRQLMLEAFGSASTTAVREMGVEVEEFLRVMVDGMERDIPRASLTAQESMKKLADQWDGLLTDLGSGIESTGAIEGMAKLLQQVRGVNPFEGFERSAALLEKARQGDLKTVEEIQAIAQGQLQAALKVAEARREGSEMEGLAKRHVGDMLDLLKELTPLRQAAADAAKEQAAAEAAAVNFDDRGEVDASWKVRDPSAGIEKYLQMAQALGWVEEATRDLMVAEEEAADRRRDALREKVALTRDTVEAIEREMEVLRLRAAGDEERADALETENRLREEARRIAERTNLSEEAALRLVREREGLRQQVDGGSTGRMAGEGERPRWETEDGSRRRIGGMRDPKKGRLTRKSFGGVSDWEELQKRKGNVGVTEFPGLDNRSFPLLDGAKAEAMKKVEPAVKSKPKAGADSPIGKLLAESEKQTQYLEQLATG